MALRSMLGLAEPHTIELANQLLATVMTTGDPDKVGPQAVKALSASVNQLRASTRFDLEPLRARWPHESSERREELSAMWGLPVPAGTEQMPQIDTDYLVRVEEWEYGLMAEVLHEGSYAEERRTLDKLMRFAEQEGLEVLGPHEEEYLTPPDAPVPRTLVRYRVRQP